MIKPWKLLSSKDISPSKWFPIEQRVYLLPDGSIVDDFTVSPINDVSMIVPITKDSQVVLVHIYKPGVDQTLYQFPAGRKDSTQETFKHLAVRELEEETGIKIQQSQLKKLGICTGFTTKSSERVHLFYVDNCEFNSTIKPDEHETLEPITVSIPQMEAMIHSGKIICAQTISAWTLAQKRLNLQ